MGYFHCLAWLQGLETVEQQTGAFSCRQSAQVKGADKWGWHKKVFRRKRELRSNN